MWLKYFLDLQFSVFKHWKLLFEITNNLAQVLRNDKMCIFIEEYDLDPVLKYYSLGSSFKILPCEFLHMK